MVEQRYHAVMEVLVARVPISHVAKSYDVHPNSVATWVRRHEDGRVAAFAERSHSLSPTRQGDSDVEALFCERAGPIAAGSAAAIHKLDRKAIDAVPSRSTV